MFLSKENLIMMPKLYIIFLYINKRSDHKNDDPQQSKFSFKTLCFINECFFLFMLK
jgi:hypothetical protein